MASIVSNPTVPSTFFSIKCAKEEIFDALALRVCKIFWKVGEKSLEASGCFIRNRTDNCIQVLTCFHDMSWTGSHDIQIVYGAQSFKGKLVNNLNKEAAEKHDLCVLDVPDQPKVFVFEMVDSFIQSRRGQKVYFAGFPLGQNHPFTHKGRIASPPSDGLSESFMIDGTIVQGHSGGPIAAYQQGELFLMGSLSSQLVDLTSALVKASETKLSRFYAKNASISKFGSSDVTTVLKDVIGNVLANLSTGIGKASACKNIIHIFQSNIVNPSETFIPSRSVEFDQDEYGVYSAFEGMQEEDVWLSRKSNDLQLEARRVSPPSKVTELPVVHGTLQVNKISEERVESHKNVAVNVVLPFLESFRMPDSDGKKADFYSRCWGGIGTIYSFGAGRLDIQSPTHDSTNLQIQIEKTTIATLLISNRLADYAGDQHKINEVINYVIHQFVGAVKHYIKTSDAIVLQVSPKEGIPH